MKVASPLESVARRAALSLLPLLFASPVRAEIPTLAREFRTERYVVSPGEIESVDAQRFLAGSFSGGLFSRGEEAGSANPIDSWTRLLGGRGEAHAQFGRFSIGADAEGDTRRQVEAEEYEHRLAASWYQPEARLSVFASTGELSGADRGVDLSLEVLAMRWDTGLAGSDLRPRVYLWVRGRHLTDPDRDLLTPAMGLYLQHAVVVGSQVYLGVNAMSDLESDVLPRTRLMLQGGFAMNPRPVRGGGGDPDAPNAPAASPLQWNGFTTAAYAAPLDSRGDARLVLQAGVSLLFPL